jgi:hypothetical protein
MKAQIKKLMVLGIVMMFASLGAIIYQGNNPVGINHSEHAFQIGSANQVYSTSITSSYLKSITTKSYNREKSWDVSHNASVNFNLSDEISTVMNQWQLIYPKVLSLGGNPICCLGVSSNSSGNISISLIAKYMKDGKTQKKISFTVETIDGTQQVVIKILPKSLIVAGTESTYWDGYVFYDQGTKTKNVGWSVGLPPWPHTVTCNFNYEVTAVSENIQIPTGVSDQNEIGVYDPSTCKSYGVGKYTNVGMVIWESLSANVGGGMVQAGVFVRPNQAPCIFYQDAQSGSGCYNGIQPLNRVCPAAGDTINIIITYSNSGDFCINACNLNNGAHNFIRIIPSQLFTPYFFSSVVETPLMNALPFQLPEFNPFSVSCIRGTANNNIINGQTAWSNGWYNYYYLQQNPRYQNLNNGFQSSSNPGTYDISLATTCYWTTLDESV